MLRFFQALMPREDKFFDLFNRHARTLVQGSLALRALLEGGDLSVAEACDRIIQYEGEADILVREVLVGVRRSFITPFDRGDIKDLIGLLDDSIDQMHKTAKAIMMFDAWDFTSQMRRIADIIVQCAELTVEVVSLLGDMRENVGRINALTEQITALEEQVDELNEAGIKALYLKHKDGNVMDFIVGNEIYDHLEKIADRFEDVANRISGIVIEQL